MAKRLAARPGILNIHRETVEHPFGSIKQWMNQGAFLMRGLEKVRGEFSLTALTYNLRRGHHACRDLGADPGGDGLIHAAKGANIARYAPHRANMPPAPPNPD